MNLCSKLDLQVPALVMAVGEFQTLKITKYTQSASQNLSAGLILGSVRLVHTKYSSSVDLNSAHITFDNSIILSSLSFLIITVQNSSPSSQGLF